MRTFTFTLDKLGKGLRPFAENPRNSEFLIQAVGMVPKAGVLNAYRLLTRYGLLADLDETFPFPQVFVLNTGLVVTTRTAIYEVIGEELIKMIEGLVAGTVWTVADFYHYLVFMNGKQTVVKDPQSFIYSVYTGKDLPISGYCIADLGGQLVVGAPNVVIPNEEKV